GPGRGAPRLLVLNEYYWPGVEATAHLLSELCEGLAGDFDVTVVTGRMAGGRGVMREIRNGVKIVRVPSTSFDRSSLLSRSVNYSSFGAAALSVAMGARTPDLILCMTDPPILGSVARVVARRFRAPYVVVTQDVFPDIAVKLGFLRNPVVIAMLERMISRYL